MSITKEMFDKLYDDNITRKEYNSIIEIIALEVDEIWRFILNANNRKIHWWDFANEGGENNPGRFDPEEYRERIEIAGDFTRRHSGEYDDGFPTSFLWTDYKPIVIEYYKKIAEADEAKRLAKIVNNSRKKELIASIKSKLTAEELKIIKFQ
jgi:hypothetical protein